MVKRTRSKHLAIHQGRAYTADGVSIEAPIPESINSMPQAEDVRADEAHWLREALEDDSIYYFAVSENGKVVGQVLLHDMDTKNRESLVAYALFEPLARGRGIGTEMLKLLQRFVIEATSIEKLVIITSRDNKASQRVAEKCGFRHMGASREDPVNGMVFEWEIQWKK
jgi:RimJ/RimL family protein N-acetyltransferase